MLSENRATAGLIEKIMATIYGELGIEYKTYLTEINRNGVEVIDSK